MRDDPRVSDKDQVVAAVHEPLAEWADGPPAGWENRSLPDYLEEAVQ